MTSKPYKGQIRAVRREIPGWFTPEVENYLQQWNGKEWCSIPSVMEEDK